MEDSWAKIDGLSILTKVWQNKDRLCEGRILKQANGQSRNGKRKRGTSGWWWWPMRSGSPARSTSSTSRNRAVWPRRSRVCSDEGLPSTSTGTEDNHCELWASLSLVAKNDDQYTDGTLHGGVPRAGAGDRLLDDIMYVEVKIFNMMSLAS